MVGLIKNFELDCFDCDRNNDLECLGTSGCKELIVWIAMDSDGEWWGYRIKPTRNKETDMWLCPNETPVPLRVEIDWRATLQRVRQGTVRKPK